MVDSSEINSDDHLWRSPRSTHESWVSVPHKSLTVNIKQWHIISTHYVSSSKTQTMKIRMAFILFRCDAFGARFKPQSSSHSQRSTNRLILKTPLSCLTRPIAKRTKSPLFFFVVATAPRRACELLIEAKWKCFANGRTRKTTWGSFTCTFTRISLFSDLHVPASYLVTGISFVINLWW